MLIHITPSNAFLSLSHGTRDIIFNVHVLDFVWVAIAAAFLLLSFSVHTFFCITLKIWYRSNVASTTKTFFPSPYFFFFFTKTFQKKNVSRFSFFIWILFLGLVLCECICSHCSSFLRSIFHKNNPILEWNTQNPKTNCMQNTIEYTST